LSSVAGLRYASSKLTVLEEPTHFWMSKLEEASRTYATRVARAVTDLSSLIHEPRANSIIPLMIMDDDISNHCGNALSLEEDMSETVYYLYSQHEHMFRYQTRNSFILENNSSSRPDKSRLRNPESVNLNNSRLKRRWTDSAWLFSWNIHRQKAPANSADREWLNGNISAQFCVCQWSE
jgi:hypothetical protein